MKTLERHIKLNTREKMRAAGEPHEGERAAVVSVLMCVCVKDLGLGGGRLRRRRSLVKGH